MSIFRKRLVTYTYPGSGILPPGGWSGGSVPTGHDPAYIAATLAECGVACAPDGYAVGPSTVEYGFRLSSLRDFGKLKRAVDALSARLGARCLLTHGGASDFAVSVERRERSPVSFARCVETGSYKSVRGASGAALGLDSRGGAVAVDLASLPHLLIAGATGSGKTVAMHTILCSLLMGATPLDARFIMIDPKRVELAAYSGIPHLLYPIGVSTQDSLALLGAAVKIMDQRYIDMSRGVTGHPKLYVVIDELADLMLTSRHQAEPSIVRLAQMGRAAGVHLIAATQRPTVNVVTGLIKANIPARLALTMASYRDANVMEVKGADKLGGVGDALYQGPDHTKPPVRLQIAHTGPREVAAVTNWWRSKDSRKKA